MSAITIMVPTLADAGNSAALDIGTATSLRLNWVFNFGSPSELSGFLMYIDHAPPRAGPLSTSRGAPSSTRQAAPTACARAEPISSFARGGWRSAGP